MTPRQIAAAIRIGAAVRPQCKGRFFQAGASCAIGAAIEGVGERDRAMELERKTGNDHYNFAEEVLGVDWRFLQGIYERNDTGHTREQIADWLDTLDVSKPTDAEAFAKFMTKTLEAVEVEQPVSSQASATNT